MKYLVLYLIGCLTFLITGIAMSRKEEELGLGIFYSTLFCPLSWLGIIIFIFNLLDEESEEYD